MSCAAIGIAVSADALNIIPTFDNSIANDPNGPAMMAAINAAIQTVEPNIVDNVTVQILFTNDPGTDFGSSFTYGAPVSYSSYMNVLRSRATSIFDAEAVSKIPNTATDPVIGGTQIHVTTALARLMGFNLGTGPAGFDSIISLNMRKMNVTRPPGVATNYDLQQVAEHEIDEVLGCSSGLPDTSLICPIDLFRYTTNLVRTFTTNGPDDAYFSVDGTNLLARFNMNAKGDYSDFWSVYLTNRWSPPGITPHSQIQDAFNTPGVVVDYGINELAMLDVIGWRTVADINQPTVTMDSPTPSGAYTVAPIASGRAWDTNGIANSGVQEVQVLLARTADGFWWNFRSNTWGNAVFNAFYNIQIASGTASWTATLPSSLADGGYQVQAQAVDYAGNPSGWVTRNFTIDNTAPTITFSPLTNQQVVFNFDQLGGTLSEAGTVAFRINEYAASGTNNLYWNGSAWISDGASPSVYLAAQVTGTSWSPAPGVTLPSRSQTRNGPYFLRAIGTDLAGNSATNEILVIRSTADTTMPSVTLDSISPGQVFTNTFLPGVFGTASDPEIGIASVTVYLMRATQPGFVYWTGSIWDSNPASLTTTYNSGNGTWSLNVSLPSGGNLINADYQIQVSADNRESPTGSQGISVDFSVDYHPVYLWTAGSFSDLDTNNNNNRWDNYANWDVGEVPPTNAVAAINGVPNGGPDNTSMGTVNIYGVSCPVAH